MNEYENRNDSGQDIQNGQAIQPPYVPPQETSCGYTEAYPVAPQYTHTTATQQKKKRTWVRTPGGFPWGSTGRP